MQIGSQSHIQRLRAQAQVSPRSLELESTAAVDSVQLSGQNTQHLEPAAHLHRAAGEYFALVATHPTEMAEFEHGLTEVQAVVGEIMYGGEWPEAEELPQLPGHSFPGEPKDNGGLSRSEQLVSEDFVQIYRKTVNSIKNPDQHKRLASAIHLCQSGLQGRVLRRDYPNYWMSTQGTLEHDAQREKQRWGL